MEANVSSSPSHYNNKVTVKENLTRMASLMQATFIVGALVGGYRGGRRATWQFLAEHQHAASGIKTRREASSMMRLRNARVLLEAGKEGVRRGAQMAGLAVVFQGTRLTWDALLPVAFGVEELLGREVAAGALTGSMLALAGKGQRLYYLRRGFLMGSLSGILLETLQYTLQNHFT